MKESEKKIISKMLDEIICRAVPKSQTVPKYCGILYTLRPDEKEGQFCGVFSYKKHVHLAISNEPELKDPKGVLLGDGKTRRHVNFLSVDEVDAKILIPLLKQAAKG